MVKLNLITKGRFSLCLVLVIILTFITNNRVAAPVALATVEGETLAEQLNYFLANESHLKGAIAGISVRSATNGKLIYEHLGNIRLRPASNMKILTAAAALAKLGPEYSFSTELLTNGHLSMEKP